VPSGNALYIFPIPIFSQRDANSISALSGVQAAAPYYQIGVPSATAVGGVPIVTVFRPAVIAISSAVYAQGMFKLGAGAVASSQSQADLGYTVAQAIAIEAGSTNDTGYVLGKQMAMSIQGRQMNVTIVGVIDNSPLVAGVNTAVFLPLAQGTGSATSPAYHGIVVFADPSGSVQAAENAVLGYLNGRSDALTALRSTGQGLQFSVVSSSSASSFLQEQVGEYSLIILAMGVVALLGGAVGMSNIMLVSVAERTREIGTLKAIGGSRRDILNVFLFESLILSLIGVALGVAGGAGLGFWLTTFRILGLNMPLVYNIPWFFAAGAIGLATGILAGVYPAWKAAGLQPVQALRTV
jgi:putative ABC transport system permease protein